jgi:ubiquinone/menaquinone biosynthesis C-methylase UbiE
MENNKAKNIIRETIEDYNSISQKYSSIRSNPWKELDFLFEDIKEGDNVLDLGCGNGRFYEWLKKSNYIGVDPSLELIKICKNNYPEANFIVALGNALPFEDNLFDKIFSIAVLHHIPSDKLRREFLLEIKRVLKDDGIFTLTVWDLKEKAKGEKDVFIPWYSEKETYFYCFNLEELIQLVKDCGFEIIDSGEILIGKKPYSNFYIKCQKKK